MKFTDAKSTNSVSKRFCRRTIAHVLFFLFFLIGASSSAFADPTSPSMSELRSTLKTSVAQMGDIVEFAVPDLDTCVQSKACDPSAWQLQIDDFVLTSAKPLVDLDRNALNFRLVRMDADKALWAHVMGSPSWDGQRSVAVSVRIDPTHVMASAIGASQALDFYLFAGWQRNLALFVFVVALIAFVFISLRSDIVRDTVVGTLPPGKRRPYSLARCQMAFWTFLIVGGFLMIWIVTGDYNQAISSQTFILFGLSSGTGLAATAIDIDPARAGVTTPSEGFFRDLLTDKDGVTVYRFQMLLWTVVLGLVFIVSVYQTLSTPTFDNNLLVLTGISAGTYLGFKIPEKQS